MVFTLLKSRIGMTNTQAKKFCTVTFVRKARIYCVSLTTDRECKKDGKQCYRVKDKELFKKTFNKEFSKLFDKNEEHDEDIFLAL